MEIEIRCKCPNCGEEFDEVTEIDIEPLVNEGYD